MVRYLSNIWQIVLRELLILRRNHIYRFCMVAFPALVVFFFTSLMDDGLPTGMPVGVVDLDNTSTSRSLVRRLDGFQMSEVVAHYPSVSEARRALQRNEIYGFLYIPKGTTDDLLASRQPKMSYYYTYTTLVAGAMMMKDMKTIGTLATKYDCIIMEDLAYFAMDFRQDLSTPFEPPYQPTVARYTDNYILLMSSSKIFSYAGQRMAFICIGDKLFDRHYPALAERYHDAGIFGPTLTASILYMITSGCTASTQYGYARMMELACEGGINFVEDTRVYERRAERMKQIFCENGFHVVYDRDVSLPVGNGFFFTLGYGRMSGGELLRELLSYGVSSISLATTGSDRGGVRACTSRMEERLYPLLEERMKAFHADHPLT